MKNHSPDLDCTHSSIQRRQGRAFTRRPGTHIAHVSSNAWPCRPGRANGCTAPWASAATQCHGRTRHGLGILPRSAKVVVDRKGCFGVHQLRAWSLLASENMASATATEADLQEFQARRLQYDREEAEPAEEAAKTREELQKQLGNVRRAFATTFAITRVCPQMGQPLGSSCSGGFETTQEVCPRKRCPCVPVSDHPVQALFSDVRTILEL